VDAVGNMGSWLGIPFKFERLYDNYEVQGGTPPPEGTSFRPAGTAWRNTDTVAYRVARDSLRTARRACLDQAEGREATRACWRMRLPRDSVLAVIVPLDTASLAVSPTLGPPILQMGDLITESEIRGLADAIGHVRGLPRATTVELPRGMSALLSKARYNRVEGLSLGLGGSLESGRFALDGQGRIGWADRVPNGELGASLLGTGSRIRLGGYRRLAAANPDVRPFGVVNSVWSLIAARDDGEYFRTLGVELTGQNTETGWWSWRLYAERQRAAQVETSLSLPRLFDSDRRFRPNLQADRASQFGAALTLRGHEPVSPALAFGGDLTLEGAAGDYRHAKASATLRAIVTPRALMAVALEASAGTSRGELPLQGRFYLGGPATLRGYDGAVTAGEAYWRGRVEVGNAFPAARVTVFSDLGWAGPRNGFWNGRPLVGGGVGASFLDGLVRFDLARAFRSPTGWRFDLYFDAPL
jgi:hypothetical protein